LPDAERAAGHRRDRADLGGRIRVAVKVVALHRAAAAVRRPTTRRRITAGRYSMTLVVVLGVLSGLGLCVAVDALVPARPAPSAVLALAASAGLPVGWQLPLWTGLAGAVTGVVLPHLSVRSQAAKRRTELRHSLTVLLSLVVTALAGAAGVEQAITDASRIGT